MTAGLDGVPVRPAAVAGTFYPARAGALRAMVARLLDEAAQADAGRATDAARPTDAAHTDAAHPTEAAGPVDGRQVGNLVPRGALVPHAGYVYSGRVAASAYRHLVGLRGRFRRVVLIGPAHFVPLLGVAV
ncbi:MAG: AmmeMemoRadiSam system protein B, partial [Frankiaceae bacterium]